MAIQNYSYDQFIERHYKGISVRADMSALFSTLTANINLSMEKIAKISRQAMESSTKQTIDIFVGRLYTEYSRRLQSSSNPIVREVLNTMWAVCEHMRKNPKGYFTIKALGPTVTQISVVSFDMVMFSQETRKARELYYRPAGQVQWSQGRKSKAKIKGKEDNWKYRPKRKGSPDIEPAPTRPVERLLVRTKYKTISAMLGLGEIIEYGRTNGGRIKPVDGSPTYGPHFTPTYKSGDENKENKGIQRGPKRKVLLIHLGGGRYIFRRSSVIKAAKGQQAIYTKYNVLHKNLERFFQETFFEIFTKELSNKMSKFKIK